MHDAYEKEREDFLQDEERDEREQAELKYVRASGECICEGCGKPYWRHPHSEHRAYDGEPWLRRLCDGSLVKL